MSNDDRHMAKMLHRLADALHAINVACDEINDGEVSAFVIEAETNIYKAIRALVDGQVLNEKQFTQKDLDNAVASALRGATDGASG